MQSRYAISEDGRKFAVGNNKTGCLSVYDNTDGEELWQKTNFPQIDTVRFSPDGNRIIAMFDMNLAAFVDTSSGKIRPISLLKKHVANVQNVYHSPVDSILVHEQWDNDLLITTKRNKILHSIPRKTFGVMDHAFSSGQYCVAEANGPVTCYDINTGKELWCYAESVGIFVSYVEQQNAYAIISTQSTCILVDRDDGSRIRSFTTPNHQPAFCLNGQQMVFTNGEVIETSTGKTTCNLNFSDGLSG